MSFKKTPWLESAPEQQCL